MNPVALLLTVLALISMALSIYVLILDPKKLLHRLFFFTIVLITLCYLVSIKLYSSEDKGPYILWYKIASVTILIVPMTLHIVMEIIGFNRRIKKIMMVILYAIYLFFIYQNINLNLLYKDFIKIDGIWTLVRTDIGPVPVIYTFTLLFSYLFIVWLLLNWYMKTGFQREKKQAKVLLFSMGLLFLFAFTNHVILRLFMNADYGAFVIYLFVWPVGIGISIIKYGFLSFSPKLFAYDVFENIEESVLVLDYNKKIILANSNAKKLISDDIKDADLMKFIPESDGINENIDKMFKGTINNFTENVPFVKDADSRLIINARFSIIKDRYKDKIGILIIGRELKGIKEFSADYRVTGRELDVIRSMTTGLSNRGIAEKLNITERTIKSHLVNIYQKLDIKNKVELINVLKRYDIQT